MLYLWGKVTRVPVGDIDFGPIRSCVASYNKEEALNQKEVLLDQNEDPVIDTSDLLDLDWSNTHTSKRDAQTFVDKQSEKPAQDLDDDLLGVDLIESSQRLNQPNNEIADLDFFGHEEIAYEPHIAQKMDDLLGLNDETPAKLNLIPEIPPVIQTIPQLETNTIPLDNPYAFLDNVHTLDTLKAMKNDIQLDDDEFVESDVTFVEPPKVHIFESSDMIIQYSSRHVN